MDPEILIKLREESLNTVYYISDMCYHYADMIIEDLNEGFWDVTYDCHGYCFVNKIDNYPHKIYCYISIGKDTLDCVIKDPGQDVIIYEKNIKITSDEIFRMEIGDFLDRVDSFIAEKRETIQQVWDLFKSFKDKN